MPARPTLRSTSRSRGFTLVELLVSTAVTSVVMTGVAAAVIGQSQAYEANARTRDTVGSGRKALSYIEAKLRMAGYGMDPAGNGVAAQAAFDFSVARDNVVTDTPGNPTDVLMLRHRDPAFRRRTTAATSTSLSLDAPLTQPIYQGQKLLLICPSGNGSVQTQASGTAAAGTSSIAVAAYTVLDCGGGQPFVVKLNEYRFFLRDDPQRDLFRVLYLDRGLLTCAAMPCLEPLAHQVEDFQVAYVMNQPDPAWFAPAIPAPDSNGNWIFGDAVGATEQPSNGAPFPLLQDDYRPSPAPADPTTNAAARRYRANAANIRGVRITLVMRSSKPFSANRLRPLVENRPAATATDGFVRHVLSTQVYPVNMMARSIFAPVDVVGGRGRL